MLGKILRLFEKISGSFLSKKVSKIFYEIMKKVYEIWRKIWSILKEFFKTWNIITNI